jgi:lipopolysaccharide transport system ATP-binding protein
MSRSDNEVLVRVEGVSKKFCRSLKKSLWYGVCDIAGELLPGRKRRETRDEGRELSDRSAQDISRSPLDTGLSNSSAPALDSGPSTLDSTHGLRAGEFFAVKDVSFELRRGECLGLIGHNGAGKTTLLKMLNGLIKPDAGSITMRGRVGALIALGAGFNPILTGRENIYINGSVLGLTKKEIDEKIDEIIDFAEIREFIDMPVQSYSSGMQVRLGFAVATAMNPDVLILDEVLAVGDGSFRHKCYQRIDSLRGKAAIIFVSHNMPDVGRICQSTVVMERGRTIFQGNALDGIARYNELNENGGRSGNSHREVRYPIREFSVEMPERVGFNEPLEFSIKAVSSLSLSSVNLSLEFANSAGNYVAAAKLNSSDFGIDVTEGLNMWFCKIQNIPLKSGAYYIILHIIDSFGIFIASEVRIQKIKVHGGHHGITADCELVMNSWISNEKAANTSSARLSELGI